MRILDIYNTSTHSHAMQISRMSSLSGKKLDPWRVVMLSTTWMLTIWKSINRSSLLVFYDTQPFATRKRQFWAIRTILEWFEWRLRLKQDLEESKSEPSRNRLVCVFYHIEPCFNDSVLLLYWDYWLIVFYFRLE